MIINKVNSNSYAGVHLNNLSAQNSNRQLSGISSNLSFTARPSKSVEKLVNNVFDKLFAAKNNNMNLYLGTTKKGDNVTIREVSLGKSADLFVSYANKSNNIKNTFDSFHLTRTINKPSVILNDSGKKVTAKEAKKIQKIIDNLI